MSWKSNGPNFEVINILELHLFIPFVPISNPTVLLSIFKQTCALGGSDWDMKKAYPFLWLSIDCHCSYDHCFISFHIFFPLALKRVMCSHVHHVEAP